jgi:hypothetical protein
MHAMVALLCLYSVLIFFKDALINITSNITQQILPNQLIV